MHTRCRSSDPMCQTARTLGVLFAASLCGFSGTSLFGSSDICRIFSTELRCVCGKKICAWLDRQAPRDLADLSELSKKGYITNTALDLAKNVCGIRLSSGVLGQTVPTRVTSEWEQELSHQGSSTGTPKECFDQLFQVLQEIENG